MAFSYAGAPERFVGGTHERGWPNWQFEINRDEAVWDLSENGPPREITVTDQIFTRLERDPVRRLTKIFDQTGSLRGRHWSPTICYDLINRIRIRGGHEIFVCNEVPGQSSPAVCRRDLPKGCAVRLRRVPALPPAFIVESRGPLGSDRVEAAVLDSDGIVAVLHDETGCISLQPTRVRTLELDLFRSTNECVDSREKFEDTRASLFAGALVKYMRSVLPAVEGPNFASAAALKNQWATRAQIAEEDARSRGDFAPVIFELGGAFLIFPRVASVGHWHFIPASTLVSVDWKALSTGARTSVWFETIGRDDWCRS